MPPVRNPIEALLDDGATAASQMLKAPAKDRDQAIVHETSSPAHGYQALDAKLKNIDAKANKAASKIVRGRRRNSHHSDFELVDSDRGGDEDGAEYLSKQQSKGKAKRADYPLASDQKRGDASGDESGATVHAVKTAFDAGIDRAPNPATAIEAPKGGGNKASHANTKSVGAVSNGKAKANLDPTRLASLSQPLVGEPTGRPVRKAKKTALGKLKAKRGKENHDGMSGTEDESEDNASSFGAEDDKHHVSGRRRTKRHLPTPATKSNIPKRNAGSKPGGKLQSVKSKVVATTASVRKVSGDKNRPSDTTARERTRGDISPIGESSVVNSTETAVDAPEEKGPRKHLASTNNDEKPKPGGKLPAKRPGALNQPVRSASRGRKPLRESPYDFPGSTPRTKKKNRSVSKAPRASVKPGAARQRMQSESVKPQDAPNTDISHRLSTSYRAASKEIEVGDSRRDKSTNQRKTKESQPPPSVVHKNKSTLQSKRRDVPANVSTEMNVTGGESTKTRQKPGSSQANAIMIEQAAESSSSPPSSPYQDIPVQRNTADQHNRNQQDRRLQTPAPMPSSPPGAMTEASHKFFSDKPTIIAFGKGGPRNQGAASSSKNRESAVISMAPRARVTADTGYSDVRDNTKGLSRTLFPSQSKAVAQPRGQASSTAGPSNVSAVGGDSFTDFTENGRNIAAASSLQRPPAAAPQSVKRKPVPKQDYDDDDGFFLIDGFDDTTLIDDDETSAKPNVQRTASQTAMPPPPGFERILKRTTAHKPLLDSSVNIGSRLKTVEAAPKSGKLKKSVVTTTAKTENEPNPAKQVAKVGSRDGAGFAASRQKAQKTVPSKSIIEIKSAKEAPAEQKAQPERKRELDELQSGEPNRKKTSALQTIPPKALDSDDSSTRQLRNPNIPQVSVVVPFQRPDRRRTRTSRQPTQVPQGVDILGSPYPKDFEVPMQTTALETFSQQADLSSDRIASSDAVVAGGLTGRLNLAAVPRISTSIQRKTVPGNAKPLPAAPNEDNRAATRIASGPLAEQLITAKHEPSVMEDPFTSSHRRVPTVEHMSKGPDFKHALRKHGIFIDQEQRSADRDEDPDKTLVNPIEHESLDSDDRRDVASSTGASDEVSAASTVSAAQKALENVGDWRNTLAPHQTHLFDSLVIASHRLVRHMVDSETANRDIVSDYRRQGEIVVAELERAHATEFQKYASGMQDWKKRAADELTSHAKRLRQDLKDAERVRAERKKARLSRGGFDTMLEELVAGLG